MSSLRARLSSLLNLLEVLLRLQMLAEIRLVIESMVTSITVEFLTGNSLSFLLLSRGDIFVNSIVPGSLTYVFRSA